MTDGILPSILVVDDDSNFREILRTKLESLGFSVEEAVDGKDGVKKTKELKPKLVIMDVQMPEMNGVEALSKIRADQELAEVKVIFVTNFGEDDPNNALIDDKFAKDIGAVGHIRKTDDLSNMIDRIKREIPVS